jgi:hypothetical protein
LEVYNFSFTSLTFGLPGLPVYQIRFTWFIGFSFQVLVYLFLPSKKSKKFNFFLEVELAMPCQPCHATAAQSTAQHSTAQQHSSSTAAQLEFSEFQKFGD